MLLNNDLDVLSDLGADKTTLEILHLVNINRCLYITAAISLKYGQVNAIVNCHLFVMERLENQQCPCA